MPAGSLPLLLTLGAHAQRGLQYLGLSVCLSVCLSFCVSVTQHLTSPMFFRLTNDTTYLTGNEGQNFCGDFPETTAFERYAVKTSEKANCLISLGLPRPDLLALCTLGAQEVTTNGMYRLPHYYC